MQRALWGPSLKNQLTAEGAHRVPHRQISSIVFLWRPSREAKTRPNFKGQGARISSGIIGMPRSARFMFGREARSKTGLVSGAFPSYTVRSSVHLGPFSSTGWINNDQQSCQSTLELSTWLSDALMEYGVLTWGRRWRLRPELSPSNAFPILPRHARAKPGAPSRFGASKALPSD